MQGLLNNQRYYLRDMHRRVYSEFRKLHCLRLCDGDYRCKWSLRVFGGQPAVRNHVCLLWGWKLPELHFLSLHELP